MTDLTLGDLSGRHLGQIVEFTDGGATYRGVLLTVQHRSAPPMVTVSLQAGVWRHTGSYRRSLPARVAACDAPDTPV